MKGMHNIPVDAFHFFDLLLVEGQGIQLSVCNVLFVTEFAVLQCSYTFVIYQCASVKKRYLLSKACVICIHVQSFYSVVFFFSHFTPNNEYFLQYKIISSCFTSILMFAIFFTFPPLNILFVLLF